jgi:ribonuclease D
MAKVEAARGGLQKLASGGPPTVEAKPVDVAPPPAPVDEKPSGGASGTTDDAPPDGAAAKAIEAIEKRDKRAREQLAQERAAAKAELEAERAEIARLRAEMSGKVTPFEELQKLAKTPGKELELLKKLGVDTEDDHERYARNTYAVSKSGKADPKNRAYAEQVSEKQGLQAELADLRRMVEETRETFSQAQQRAQAEAFANQYLDEAVKAIPADPSFIGLAHTANPKKARAALLAVGQRLESETGEVPTHAEVIAAYEADTRAELRDRGLSEDQISAMLRPKAAAKPAPVAAHVRTLDPSAGPTTPPVNGHPTREDRIAAARAGLRKITAAGT